MAQFSPAEIIERSEQNVHPPAHFMLLSFWAMVFSGSLTSLRYYGLIWGMLTVVAGGFLAMATFSGSDENARSGVKAGLFAATLIALSSLHIHWSQQVKMYTLGTCMTCWSSYLLLTWMQRRDRWRLVWYVPAAAILTLQHHYGTFTVFGQLAFAIIWALKGYVASTDRTRLFPVFIAGWVTTSLWSLWLPSFLIQRQLVKAGYWISAFKWEDALNVWGRLFTADSRLRPDENVALIVGQMAFVLIAILMARKSLGSRLVGWLVLIPWLVALIWSVVDQNVMIPRYFINAHVCLLIGLAILIAAIPNRVVQGTVFVAAVFMMLIPSISQREMRSRHAALPGMSEALCFLQLNRTSGEPVVVCNPMLYLNVVVHGENTDGIYAVGQHGQFPHYQGTPVMRESEYLDLTELSAKEEPWVWTLDAENWLGGNWKTKTPSGWELEQEKRIRELYGTLVLRLYSLPSESLPSDSPETASNDDR